MIEDTQQAGLKAGGLGSLFLRVLRFFRARATHVRRERLLQEARKDVQSRTKAELYDRVGREHALLRPEQIALSRLMNQGLQADYRATGFPNADASPDGAPDKS